jgi:hypothetical protein
MDRQLHHPCSAFAEHYQYLAYKGDGSARNYKEWSFAIAASSAVWFCCKFLINKTFW